MGTSFFSYFQDSTMSDEHKNKQKPKKDIFGELLLMTNCKVCGKEVQETKLIMHITRNTKCKMKYGKELDEMKEKKKKERSEYQFKYQNMYNEKNEDKLRKKRAERFQESKPNAKKSKNLSDDLEKTDAQKFMEM